jgi:AcrR family transcriptional regulator
VKSSSRDHVLEAARRLFAERGYPSVTIRQIASEAGLSPSMVMKVGGSKAKIYEDAAPLSLEPFDSSIPKSEIGKALADRILLRREHDMSEPWVQSVFRTADAPDPKTARLEFHTWIHAYLNAWLVGDDALEQRAELLACLMTGLAVGLRAQRLLANVDDSWIADHYGRLMQQVIDGDVELGSS